MQTRPLVLTPYLRVHLPYELDVQQSIVDRLMTVLIERWRPLGVAPVYRLIQEKLAPGKAVRQTHLCIWVYGNPISSGIDNENYLIFGYTGHNEARHEHLFIHQELEKAQGKAHNRIEMKPFLLDPDERNPWTLMLPLNRREYGRLFHAGGHTRKQFAQLGPDQYAVIWRSRGRWEGVFEVSDTGEKVLIEYSKDGEGPWTVVAGQIFIASKKPRELTRDQILYRQVLRNSDRLKTIPPLVLFQRTERSYRLRMM